MEKDDVLYGFLLCQLATALAYDDNCTLASANLAKMEKALKRSSPKYNYLAKTYGQACIVTNCCNKFNKTIIYADSAEKYRRKLNEGFNNQGSHYMYAASAHINLGQTDKARKLCTSFIPLRKSEILFKYSLLSASQKVNIIQYYSSGLDIVLSAVTEKSVDSAYNELAFEYLLF